MLGRKLMAIAWPAFLAACLLQAVVFALVDPLELHWPWRTPGWSRQAIYAGAFFVFWGICGVASSLAVLLRGEPA